MQILTLTNKEEILAKAPHLRSDMSVSEIKNYKSGLSLRKTIEDSAFSMDLI